MKSDTSVFWSGRLGRGLLGAAVVASLTLLLFAGAECGVRASGVAAARGDLVVDNDRCYFGWDANTHDVHVKETLTHEVFTDARGFRVDPQDGDRAEAACRILAVGDSFTEGLYVAAEETFAARTEALLRGQSYDVRVDNGGMRGHTILQERIAALGRWEELGHSVVVMEHTANDLQDLLNAVRAGCTVESEPPFAFEHASAHPLNGLRLRKVAQDVRDRIAANPVLALMGGQAAAPPSDAECSEIAEAYAAQALNLARALHAKKRKLLFVLAEKFVCGQRTRAADWQSFTDSFTQRLRAEGAEVLDASGVFWAPGTTLRPLDGHPSPAGHAALAQRIGERLMQTGWLDDCR